MEIEDALQKAQEIVQNAAIDETFRPIAFGKALDELLRVEAVGSSQQGTSLGKETAPYGQEQAIGAGLDGIAKKLGLEVAQVAEIYFDSDGDLGIGVPSSRLAQGKKAGARQLALLVAAGRQAGGFDESGWTQSEVIRNVCDHYGKFDSNNFAFTITKMDNVFHIRGKGLNREVRLKQPGFEQAAALIRDLVSDA